MSGQIWQKKVLVILLIILLVSVYSFGSVVGYKNIDFEKKIDTDYISLSKNNITLTNNINQNCYGFIIPLPAGEDSTYETFLNSKTRNIINDLLRENLIVYWLSQDISILSSIIKDTSAGEINSFKKGDFIIPFSGIQYKDVLINSIIFDYFYNGEIDENELELDIYYILGPIEITGYILQDPKIVQYLGRPVQYHWPVYLKVAEPGGFFNIEFLSDSELTQLNNDDFNVLMWPYKPDPAREFEILLPLADRKARNKIRDFVNNGGGYIGSCYGAEVAAGGNTRPIPFSHLFHFNNPNLSFLGILGLFAITDTLAESRILFENELYVATVEITDINHPIVYGLNSIMMELWQGAGIGKVGKNTKVIGIYKDLTSEKNPLINRRYVDKMIESPAYLTNNFGKGKVVLYTVHPEMINNISLLSGVYTWEGDKYYGRRLIHNTLFYVTSKDIENNILDNSYPLSFIENIGLITTNLSINQSNNSQFIEIKERIKNLKNNLNELDNLSIDMNRELSELFPDFLEKTKIFQDLFKYSIGYIHHYCNIYLDYYNKSLSSLKKLDNICLMYFKYNESIINNIKDLKTELSNRLNNSEQLIRNVTIMANYIFYIMKFRKHIFQKLHILIESRKMLRTFENGLKYIPQTYFETIKLVRNFWYNYETNLAINSI